MENNKTREPQYGQKTPSNVEKEKAPLTKRVGDAIEQIGDKLEHSGLKKIGDAIENLGDKIEHSGDSKKDMPKRSA
jgi:hypothetical protein